MCWNLDLEAWREHHRDLEVKIEELCVCVRALERRRRSEREEER